MFGKSGRRYIVAGKIFVIETSNGNVVTQFESDDNPVVVCQNAYIKKIVLLLLKKKVFSNNMLLEAG